MLKMSLSSVHELDAALASVVARERLTIEREDEPIRDACCRRALVALCATAIDALAAPTGVGASGYAPFLNARYERCWLATNGCAIVVGIPPETGRAILVISPTGTDARRCATAVALLREDVAAQGRACIDGLPPCDGALGPLLAGAA